jgi:hypothetical protein
MLKRNVTILLLFICISLAAQTSIKSFPQPARKELVKLLGENAMLTFLTGSMDHQGYCQTGNFYSFSDQAGAFTQKYLYLGKVNTCRAGGCNDSGEPAIKQESEFFEYFILFDAAGAIMIVRIYRYAATHGHEITSKAWLRQFANYNGITKLVSGKNIDAISGATISVEAITRDVEQRTRWLNNYLVARKPSTAL